MKQIVIAGGGFAGVRLARKLKRLKNVSVTVINDSADFRYSPALYRAATGFKIGTVRIPLEWMLLDVDNANLTIGKVTKLDQANKKLILADNQTFDYDYLILGLEAVTSYFGIEGLDKLSYGIKSVEEVMELKSHIHNKLASGSDSEHNYAIVGAGPTGVELAGVLGYYLKRISKRHKVKSSKLNIYLVEAAPRILQQMPEKASRVAERTLKRLNVKILTNTLVKSESVNSLHTSEGTIKTHTVIWTAGTNNNPFFKEHDNIFQFDKRGKVIVDEHLSVEPNIYVCGDNASTPHSGLAYTAVKDANFIAKDIKSRLRHKKRKDYKPSASLQVVPVSFNVSVLQYKNMVIHGKMIGLVRKIADYIGYSDVLGPLKALTIWSSTEQTEESCRVCRK